MKISRSLVARLISSDIVQRLMTQQFLSFDNSGFSMWQQCCTKGFINTGLRRVSARGQTPLLFGGAVHEGLAARLAGASDREAIDIALATATKSGLDDHLDEKRNRRTLADLLGSYFIHCDCTGDWIRPVLIDGVAVVEKGFEFELSKLELTGLKYLPNGFYSLNWKGKLDVFERYQGDLWILDHKTTSIMGEKFIDDKLRSSQMLGYAWAGSFFASAFGETIQGVRINALATRSKGFEFKQFPIPYTPQAVLDWRDETIVALTQFLRWLDGILASCGETPYIEFTPNRDACVTKYGRCAYFDACNSLPVMLERILFDDAQYIANVWDPLME